MAYDYSQQSFTEVTAPPVSITTPRSNDASTTTSTQRTAQHLPSGGNWCGYPTNKQTITSTIKSKPLLNHKVTSNTVRKTEGKNYHDLQPMRLDETIDMPEIPGPSAFRMNQDEKVASVIFSASDVFPKRICQTTTTTQRVISHRMLLKTLILD